MNIEVASLLTADLVRAIGWTLVHFVWQGGLIAAVLGLALRASAKARTRHDLCLAAMAVMALCPVATFLSIRAGAPILVVVPGAVEPGGVLWQAPLVGLWAAGVLALAVRAAGGIILIEGLRRRAQALPAEWTARCRALNARLPTALRIVFRQSIEADGPLLVGWFRPMVLIPTAALLHMPVDQLEALILHEIAHVRRLDAFANLIQTLVETVLFYHPAVWWVGARLRVEREHCCDDMAVAASGDVSTYVRALVSMEACRASPEPALAANGGSIRDRAARLLRLEQDVARPVLPRLAALAMLAAGAMVSVYGAGVEAAPDPAAPTASSTVTGRLGPVTEALIADTRPIGTPAPAPASVAPTVFKAVPPPLPPAPEIRERAPWVDPSGEAARRITTLDRMIASNRDILTSSRELLAASETALASPAGLTEVERADFQVNVEWLPGAVDLADRLLAMRLANREAVVQAESARRDLLAGRAFRADVARTAAHWDELDRKTLALASERVSYLMRMADARKAATGEDLGSAARESLRAGGAMRQAIGETRDAGAAYVEARQQAADGTLAADTAGQAADAYRSAQQSLVGKVEKVTTTSNRFESDLVRRYREQAEKAQAAAQEAAIAPQPAAR